MHWTRAIHLTHWADTQEARHTLPLLIRRLIRGTVPTLKSLNFPAAEQVQRPGFDGVVETAQGNEFVPAGASRWEMGVDKDPRSKAEKDFATRTKELSPEEQSQFVFVFVTPRSWQKKDEWAQEKRAGFSWRDILVLDANDLEHWLEIARGVDFWFARLTSRAPEGVQDLESYWNSVRSLAEHPLTPSVFTTSRDPEASAIKRWLAGQPDSFFMKTYGLTDGIDFLAALSAGDDNEKLQNGLIVYTPEAWRYLSASREQLLLAAWPTLELNASDTSGAVSAGHHVFVTSTRGVAGQAAKENTLRRQDFHSISEALRASGFSDSRALSLGQACCGSSTILKRLITKHPETRFPAWSRDEFRSAIAPFALLGGWSHVDPEPPKNQDLLGLRISPPLDLLVVTELVGCTREKLEGILSRWQRDSEPLFLRFGDAVFVSSREDAWYLLGGSISERHLKRFQDLAILVLEEDNPALELPPDKRWSASFYGKTHSLSSELRRSIIETLALMTTYPTADKPDARVDFKQTVQTVLETVLPKHATWQRWASFGSNLFIIAEAAPELFLSRAEEDLRSDHPELPKLFQDQSPSILDGAIHSDLLWALETLAWIPEYLLRVSVVLAKLAASDPGGKYGNRPAHSLREIFQLSLWQTNASVQERLSALAEVIEVEPQVGWKLVEDTLPGALPEILHTTQMPRWRSWAEGWSRARRLPQIFEYGISFANFVISIAGSDPGRWVQVLDGMLTFNNREITEKVVSVLDEVKPDENEEGVFSLWNALREVSAHRERRSGIRWDLFPELHDRLTAIRDRLQPTDPVLRHHWLFDEHVELPYPNPRDNFQAHKRAVDAAQLESLREIISASGAEGLFRLLKLARDTASVGWITGEKCLLTWKEAGLPSVLDATDDKHLQFINAYIASRYHHEGWEFVNSIPLVEGCLPFKGDVWRWLRKLGTAIEKEYWQHVRGYLRHLDLEETQIACRSLIGVGRPFTAVDVLHVTASLNVTVPKDLIAEVLEATFTVKRENDLAPEGVQYAVQQLIMLLQQDKEFDRSRLAHIEWALLQFLDRESSDVGPDTLVREIEVYPEFFVELLKVACPSQNEPPPESPLSKHELLRVRQARTLLEDLAKLPGTNEEGVLDYNHLRSWTQQVRSQAAACDRVNTCDEILGGMFGRACKRPDGNWPSPEVAKLIDEVGSEQFFSGFINGLIISRGTFWRSQWEGGEQERSLAEQYRELANYTRPFSPKLAEAFLRLVESHERAARSEDEDAERGKLGR